MLVSVPAPRRPTRLHTPPRGSKTVQGRSVKMLCCQLPCEREECVRCARVCIHLHSTCTSYLRRWSLGSKTMRVELKWKELQQHTASPPDTIACECR